MNAATFKIRIHVHCAMLTSLLLILMYLSFGVCIRYHSPGSLVLRRPAGQSVKGLCSFTQHGIRCVST